jgi:hypothetical protein
VLTAFETPACCKWLAPRAWLDEPERPFLFPLSLTYESPVPGIEYVRREEPLAVFV